MTWKDFAIEHAKKDAPNEACGLVGIYKGKEKYYPCKNLADDFDWYMLPLLKLFQKSDLYSKTRNIPNEDEIIQNLNLLISKYNCNNLIYSSSACVYGKQPSPCREDMFTGISITNPYGETKYMCEQLIKEECKINRQFNAVSLRYFNPVGAHSSGLIGEHKSTSLMSNLISSLIYDTSFIVF